jgi:hypothetical protein
MLIKHLHGPDPEIYIQNTDLGPVPTTQMKTDLYVTQVCQLRGFLAWVLTNLGKNFDFELSTSSLGAHFNI